MVDVSEQMVRELALVKKRPALVEFWVPWCVYNLLLKPKMETLDAQFGGRVLVGRLNVEEHMPLVKELGIEFVPALAFFHGGRVAEKWYGDLPLRALCEAIAKYEPVNP
jgi:thioredoxin-like negative regulator of GroEL